MHNLPTYIALVFVLTTLLTVALLYKASNYSKITLVVLLSWLALQAGIGLSGFYTITDSIPPRFLLLVIPPLLLIIGLFISASGQKYINNLDLKTLTILHTVRIPVEIVLFWLFVHNVIPQLMTFEGRNFDIMAGITAPLVYYFGFIKKSLGRKAMLIWNFICLGLLFNIVINAILSAPFSFQKFAFEQPNIAILYFPFNWLACSVVPIVLFCHLVTIKQLWYETR